MNQSVKLSKAISYIILACALLIFLAIWPGNFIRQTHVSKSNEIFAMESDPVSVERNVTQMFVGEGAELSAVDLYVCNDMRGETITFRLYDGAYKEIFNTFHVVKESQKYPGFVNIPVGYDLVKDQEYYFTIEGLSADMVVAYEERETSTSIVNGFMSYGGIQIQRYNVIIRYEYKTPFVWWQVILSALVLAGVAFALTGIVKKVFEKTGKDKEVKVHTVMRVLLNPLVILLGAILCLMIYPGRVFGTGVLNYAFLGGSVFLLTCILVYLINYKRQGEQPLVNLQGIKENISGYLQSFCLAMTIWYCCEYLNGLYNIHHYLAARRMIIWFLLGIICTYSLKRLVNILHGIYLVAAGIAAWFYAKPYFGIPETGELYQLTANLFVVGGFVIILLITDVIRLILKKDCLEQKLSLPYLAIFALFIGMLIAFRNTRDWVVALVVLFVLYYFRGFIANKTDKFLTTFSNGVLLNFVFMVLYCMMHRPFNKFRLYRYGMRFHTVTVTGVYLSLIIAVALVAFLRKYKKSKRMIDAWPQLLILVVANAYQILTLSRTGYLASFTTIIFVVIAFCIGIGNKVWKHTVKILGTIVITTVLFCPIVFTMTRIIPAFTNDPVYADVEVFGEMVVKGSPKDSPWYIDIDYYLERAGEKILNIEKKESSDAGEVMDLWKDMYVQARKVSAPDEVFVADDTRLIASAEDEPDDLFEDYSNGRIAIFKDYISEWNLFGHDEMGFEASFGGMHVHAHNVFLQVIHDHGLITGIVFIIFGMTTLIVAMCRFYKKKREDAMVIVAVVLAFAISGLTEWNFHLCNPFGIALFMVIMPLLFECRGAKKDETRKESV